MPNDALQMNTAVRAYYDSGITRPYSFRIRQLQKLKEVLLANEAAINAALYSDLRKSAEEVWASELGLLLAEIRITMRNLKRWMKPKSVATNLINFPSSSTIYRDPLGVTLIIAPWNYPLQLLLVPLVGSIAGGNCAVLKPSEFAPATAAIIEKIIAESFVPEYTQVVNGDGAVVIPAMMKSFRFDHIFYTGSTEVGRQIYQQAAAELIPVTLELGGKSPAIVEADADIESTARRIVLGKFLNAGQTCIAPDYVLVHESIRSKLIERMAATIGSFYGMDTAKSADFGRIINTRRFDKLLSYLSDGTVRCGGEHNRMELFIAPTLLDNVSADAPVMKEEICGPILPVLSFSTMDGAMSIIKKNANPLAFYLFTSDKSKEKEWITALPFGGGCINNTDWQFTNHHLPFGGVGASGVGAYHGKFSFDTFTRAKPVLKTPVWFDPRIKYPPYKGKLNLLKKLFR